jgi:hypothetical protein
VSGITNVERARRLKAKVRQDRAHVLSVGRKFGVTPEQYEAMWQAQDGRCAICMNREGRRRFAVDHDHNTNVVRALLCSRCNDAIGRFEWDLHVANNAMTYLANVVEDYERTSP